MREHFGHLCARLSIPLEELLRLGRAHMEDPNEPFCMTALALRIASQSNAVSKLHGSVTRKIWSSLYPHVPTDEIPIGHITNGIHIPSWYSREVARLYSRYLGPRWQEDPVDSHVWDRVERIPDGELWRARERLRETLVSFSRKRLHEQFQRRGMPLAIVRTAEEALDPDALTIGFARRFAVYKRASLLLRDPDRLARLLNDPDRPVQIVFAGKAHPADHPGKHVMREIVHLAAEMRFRRRIVFLEDYDMEVARAARPGRRRVAQHSAPASGGERNERNEGGRQRRASPERPGRLVGGGVHLRHRLGDRERRGVRRSGGAGSGRERGALRSARAGSRSPLLPPGSGWTAARLDREDQGLHAGALPGLQHEPDGGGILALLLPSRPRPFAVRSARHPFGRPRARLLAAQDDRETGLTWRSRRS